MYYNRDEKWPFVWCVYRVGFGMETLRKAGTTKAFADKTRDALNKRDGRGAWRVCKVLKHTDGARYAEAHKAPYYWRIAKFIGPI